MTEKLELPDSAWDRFFERISDGDMLYEAVSSEFAGIAQQSWVYRQLKKNANLGTRYKLAKSIGKNKPRKRQHILEVSCKPKTRKELAKFQKHKAMMERVRLVSEETGKAIATVQEEMRVPNDWRWIGVIYPDARLSK